MGDPMERPKRPTSADQLGHQRVLAYAAYMDRIACTHGELLTSGVGGGLSCAKCGEPMIIMSQSQLDNLIELKTGIEQ